jgi:hypothetical protein
MPLFNRQPAGASVPLMSDGFAFQGQNPYVNSLPDPGSNGITHRAAIVGAFGIPSSYGAWQGPVTAPPVPQPGAKGILPDQNIVKASKRTVPLFSPAPAYDPNQPL